MERVTKETNAGRGVYSSQGHDRIGEQHARKRALKSKCKSYGRHADAQLRVYHEPLGRPPHGAHNGSKSIMTTGDRTADASTRLCNLEKQSNSNNYYYRYARSEKGGIAKLYGTARFISSSVCKLMTSSWRFVGLFQTYQAGRSRRRREVWLATNTPGCNARQRRPRSTGGANTGPSFGGRRRR